MTMGPALVVGALSFPLFRHENVLGRADPVRGDQPDIDLAQLGLGRAASRRHAAVTVTPGGLRIRDLGSRLGTAVNGEPLPPGEPRHLADGDTVTIGSVTLTVDIARDWPPGVVAEWESAGDPGSTTVGFTTAWQLPLAGQLPAALRAGQLGLLFQPQVVLATGEVRSVEALIRWQHPEHGLVVPGRFVPLAEDTGAIAELTAFALAEGAAQARRWRDAGRDLSVAVNVSVKDLDDGAFLDRVVAAVETAGAEPHELLLEVTESAVMSRPDVALQVLEELRARGFRLGIDDFGAGESSLGYLAKLPVHEVKLDGLFALDRSPRSATVVRGAVAMAHDLGLEVVAEGIEDLDAAERMAQLGCDRGQGYFFGRPVGADEVDARIGREAP